MPGLEKITPLVPVVPTVNMVNKMGGKDILTLQILLIKICVAIKVNINKS